MKTLSQYILEGKGSCCDCGKTKKTGCKCSCHDLKESVNIKGDFNGNLYINSTEQQQVEEKYTADMEYNGELYRIEMTYDGVIPARNELTEMIQDEYPGAIVQNVYPPSENRKVLGAKKVYHNSEWS